MSMTTQPGQHGNRDPQKIDGVTRRLMEHGGADTPREANENAVLGAVRRAGSSTLAVLAALGTSLFHRTPTNIEPAPHASTPPQEETKR